MSLIYSTKVYHSCKAAMDFCLEAVPGCRAPCLTVLVYANPKKTQQNIFGLLIEIETVIFFTLIDMYTFLHLHHPVLTINKYGQINNNDEISPQTHFTYRLLSVMLGKFICFAKAKKAPIPNYKHHTVYQIYS